MHRFELNSDDDWMNAVVHRDEQQESAIAATLPAASEIPPAASQAQVASRKCRFAEAIDQMGNVFPMPGDELPKQSTHKHEPKVAPAAVAAVSLTVDQISKISARCEPWFRLLRPYAPIVCTALISVAVGYYGRGLQSVPGGPVKPVVTIAPVKPSVVDPAKPVVAVDPAKSVVAVEPAKPAVVKPVKPVVVEPVKPVVVEPAKPVVVDHAYPASIEPVGATTEIVSHLFPSPFGSQPPRTPKPAIEPREPKPGLFMDLRF